MSSASPSRYSRSAWLTGSIVLLALAVAVAGMLRTVRRDRSIAGSLAARLQQPPPGGPVSSGDGARSVDPEAAAPAAIVQGVVLGPDGSPIGGAKVTFHRLLRAWPEWQAEQVDQAYTREDGRFQFRCRDRHGTLLGVQHPRYADLYAEVPLFDRPITLRATAGYELSGYVWNDVGAPVPNARVAIESLPGDTRRAVATVTSADGRFAFGNLAAGPARITAHHESWQPAVQPALTIGDRRRVDLRFERPSMAALRGRVVSASSQQAIVGATVQLLPLNHKPGLVEPIGTLTDADGAFLLEGLPRGRVQLLVRHPEFGSFLRPQSIGAVSTPLAIELPARSLVRGQLFAERHEGVFRGGEVLELRDATDRLAFVTIDAEGRFACAEPLAPGWGELRSPDRALAFQTTFQSWCPVHISEAATTELDVIAQPPSTVRGRFVDVDGRPLGGVELLPARLFNDSARGIGASAWALDIANLGRQVAQLVGVEQEGVLAVSDAEGRFELRGFQPGPVTVRGVLPGFGSRWLAVTMPPPGEPADLGDVPMAHGGGIRGRVLRGDRPFAGAIVAAISRDGLASATTLSERDGSFTIDDLPPDAYRVRARVAAQPVPGGEEQVVVDPGAVGEPVVLTVDLGRELRGLVTSRDGQPVPDALVGVRGPYGQISVTDGNGAFAIELPREATDLQVSLGDRSLQRVMRIAPEQRTVTVELDVAPSATLVGQVLGLPGRVRQTGGLLRMTPLGGDGRRDGETRTRWIELPDGELRWPQCPSGLVRVELWCEGHAPFVDELLLEPNKDHRLGEVLLEPGLRLRGRVVDEAGAVVPDAMVLLGEETDLDLFSSRVRTGEDGGFEIRGVTSRSSRLVVRASGFAARSVDVQLPGDVLARDPLQVRLERGATVEVVVARALAPDGGLVQLRRQGRLLASAELDDRGRAWFANRSVGSYGVQLFGSERVVPVEVAPKVTVVRVQIAEVEK